MVGLKAALDFHQALGRARVYARIHELAGRVRDPVRERPQLRLANASADAFSGGLVSFEPAKGDLKRVLAGWPRGTSASPRTSSPSPPS